MAYMKCSVDRHISFLKVCFGWEGVGQTNYVKFPDNFQHCSKIVGGGGQFVKKKLGKNKKAA